MTDTPKSLAEKEKIIAFLLKSGFTELKMKEGVFTKGDRPNMRMVDTNKSPIEVCVSDGISRGKETYEIPELDDVRRYIEYVQGESRGAGNRPDEGKKEPGKKKGEELAPETKQWKCDKCGAMNGEILDFCKDCGTARVSEKSLHSELQPSVMAPEGTLEGNRQRNKPASEVVEPEGVAPHVPARVHRPDALVPVQSFSPQGSMIKGMQPALKEIGKIKIGRKGEKKTGTGYRLPEKFDHFEITTVLRDQNGNLIPDTIMKQLGESPKELSVMLLYNDPTLNFTTRYNEYKGGKCMCQGDGVDARTIEGEKIECNPDTCPKFQQKKCKPNGILSVILTDSPRLGGVYKFRTTSYNSIRSILSSLFFIRSLTGGVLAMIPLKLTVTPQTVQPRDSQTAQTIYVVNIEFAGTAQQLLEKTVEVSKFQTGMRAQIQQLEATARLALAAPESEAEIRDVEAEYYPEAQAQEVGR